jgi:hypothetical protein
VTQSIEQIAHAVVVDLGRDSALQLDAVVIADDQVLTLSSILVGATARSGPAAEL